MKNKTGYLYCIVDRSKRCCQIGYSLNPVVRLNNLRMANPDSRLSIAWSSEGTRALEHYLQDKFTTHLIAPHWHTLKVLDLVQKLNCKLKSF